MNPTDVLDNPVWHSLCTNHAHFALGDRLAKRYPPDVAPFVALANLSEAAFADLARITALGETLVLRGFELPADLPGWQIHEQKQIVQMIYEPLQPPPPPPPPEVERGAAILTLTDADLPDMRRLIDIAQPGPFLARTIRLGTYLGIRIRHGDQLIALAGERMVPPGYREISAVCTHPDHRGRGYARLLMTRLMAQQIERGEVPILHVMPENVGAQRVYQSLGFRKRRDLPYAALSRKLIIKS